MAWIESHEELADHHKTHLLAQQLNCSIPTAVGHLHLLWHYTLKVAWIDGDLSKHSPSGIARGCWWEGNPEDLIKALQVSGHLDGLKVHDWQEYASQIIYQRKYNVNRRKSRASFPLSSCKTAVSTSATLPNLTVPNHITTTTAPVRSKFSKPTSQEVTTYAKTLGFELDGSHFCDYYESKGWVIGKQPMRDWKAAVRTWKKNGFNAQGDSYATRSNTASRGYIGAAPITDKYATIAIKRKDSQDDQDNSGHNGLSQ